MAKFNNWTNRKTWAVNLWLTNDEYIYNQAKFIARSYRAEQKLAEFFECLMEDDESIKLDCYPTTDVNWLEIIETSFSD